MKPTICFMEKYRYLCYTLINHQMPPLFVSLDQIQKIRKIVFYLVIYVFEKREAFWHKIQILNCLRIF